MVESDRTREQVEVAGEGHRLGDLVVPSRARGIVLFAHGSGSSRHSPRNRRVAEMLNRADLATLLFDLLTDHEEAARSNVFDIDLLSRRLISAVEGIQRSAVWSKRPLGFFGASTGAAAALQAAADPGVRVDAVVSRGGRPDLALPYLGEVSVPTLLIVGGRDTTVLDLNRSAQQALAGESRLEVVPGAGHLFEEPGALDQVADLARGWFVSHFMPPG